MLTQVSGSVETNHELVNCNVSAWKPELASLLLNTSTEGFELSFLLSFLRKSAILYGGLDRLFRT
jgi:hypothetical protein